MLLSTFTTPDIIHINCINPFNSDILTTLKKIYTYCLNTKDASIKKQYDIFNNCNRLENACSSSWSVGVEVGFKYSPNWKEVFFLLHKYNCGQKE